MKKVGKINLLSIVVISVVLLLLYSIFTVGLVPVESPKNHTNASATFGLSNSFFPSMSSFNGTAPQFKCNVSTTSSIVNISRVALFINNSNAPISNSSDILNLSYKNISIIGSAPQTFIFNVTTKFAQGRYAWMCQMEDNASVINQSDTHYFIVDYSPPSIINLTATKKAAVTTSDVIYLTAVFKDELTSIQTVKLYANISGAMSNQANISGQDGVVATNNNSVNLSFAINPEYFGHVFNLSFFVNDSVNNYVVSAATVFGVTVDNALPGPIVLNAPVDGFNTSATGATFSFNVSDNNEKGALTCGLNVSVAGDTVTTSQVATTNNTATSIVIDLPTGNLNWNISCKDPAGNVNTSETRIIRVDRVNPVFDVGAAGGLSSYSNNTASSSIASSSTIVMGINISDNQTMVESAKLFANISGTNTELNVTSTFTNADANLSYALNGSDAGVLGFYFWANDTVGNAGTSNTMVIRVTDSTAPDITAVNNSNQSSATLNFTFTATDNGGGTLTCNVTFNGTNNITGITLPSGSTYSNTSADLGSQGKYNWSVVCRDSDLNTRVSGNYTFTHDTTAPTLSISPANASNVISSNAITVTSTDTFTAVKTIAWSSSCGGSGTATSGNVFYPFNDTSNVCPAAGGNRTLTINATDHVGNSNFSLYLYGTDDTAPTVVIASPVSGSEVTSAFFNITATDDFLRISYLGYYLDDRPMVNISLSSTTNGLGQAALVYAENATVTLTPGEHTLKFTANDTVGNWGNSSQITFVVRGNLELANFTVGLNTILGTELSMAPIFRTKGTDGTYSDTSAATLSNNTFELLLNVNGSGTPTNVTLTDLVGGSANWAKINMTYIKNSDAASQAGIQRNWTNTVAHIIYVNGSLDSFATDNDQYFGTAILPVQMNVSNSTKSSIEGFWWIEDETNLNSVTNISTNCGTSVFTASTATPCWNYTTNGRTILYVPHFSIIVAVNDSTKPTYTINAPNARQTVSQITPSITTSSDGYSCYYILNITDGSKTSLQLTNNKSLLRSPTAANSYTCEWANAQFKNGVYNWTFNVTDGSGNFNESFLLMTMVDNAAPNSGLIGTATVSTTTASVSISSVNESVNATVHCGTANDSLSDCGNVETFGTSATVPVSGLTAGTTYYYNVSLCDYNGNCNRNGTFTFTTDSAASTTTTTSSSGGGGGGGGAAGGANTLASQSQVWSAIATGSSFAMSLSKSDIGISEVSVSGVTKDLNDVEIKIASLIEKPYSADAAEKVYQYLEIVAKNIDDDDATTIKIKFKVPKSWLSANGVAQDNIALWHYDSGWNMLDTKVTSSDSEYVYYEAETPGFSFFAIGTADAATETADQETTTEEEADAEEAAAEEDVPSEEAEPTEGPVEEGDMTSIAWIIFAIIVVVGLVLYFTVVRKKK